MASLGIFNSHLLNQGYDFSLSVPSGISQINCPYICFSFQFSTSFSFSDFLKSFSDLQNPDMKPLFRNKSLNLLLYFLANSIFISFSFTLSYCSISRYLYPSSSIVFINYPFGRFKPLLLTDQLFPI